MTYYKILVFTALVFIFTPTLAQTSGVVSQNGLLTVDGNTIKNENNQPFNMAGNSLFWSGFGVGMPFYDSDVVDFIVEDWQANMIRIPMAVEEADGALPPTDPSFNPANLTPNPSAQGYFNNPEREYNRIRPVIQAAIDNDIYVIVDFHSHFADAFREEAITFFTDIATEFGDNPHIIYEIFNEPIGLARNRSGSNDSMAFSQFGPTWNMIIRPYAVSVINAIRAIDPDNMIIVGTPGFSQGIETAAANPITAADLTLPTGVTNPNLAYTLHFYAGQPEHSALRGSLQNALDAGIPIVVTEWGTVAASGNGTPNLQETQEWMRFLKDRNISHANWSLSDTDESSAVIQAEQGVNGLLNGSLTESGNLVRCIIQEWDADNFDNCTLGEPTIDTNPNPSLFTKVEVETPQGQIDPNSGATSEFRSNGLSEDVRADGEGILTGFVQGEACVFRLNDITTSGFTIAVELSSSNGGYTLELRRDSGSTLLATQSVPDTGGLENYQTVIFSNIPFTGPNQEIAIGVAGSPGGSVNIESFTYFNESSTPCPTITRYTQAGGWDNGMPNTSLIAIIDEDYSTLNTGSITTCNLIISEGAKLTIGDESYVNVVNDIIVNGTLDISNQGSLVQMEESSVTINNGTITLSKTTPIISDRNFVVMSSPMSSENRDRAYGQSRTVFSIIPENFIPFDLTAFPEFSGAENFLDDDNDYLLRVTGDTALPIAGIGQLVFPQPAPNVGDGSYTITYSQDNSNPGTLNSGTIMVPIHYNGPATIDNYNLLGNPYASAIDVTAFINNNDAVDTVYYWDHLTNPTSELPGIGSNNFSMNDISMRNAMMGTAAVNGGIAPGQFMASGQGFGIKALGTENSNNTPVIFSNSMRVVDNNDGFRNNAHSESEKLWLNLTTTAYDQASSQIGVGFTDQATAGFDHGYDSKRLGTFISLFTILDGEYLAIQGREAFNSQIELSLGFTTTIETQETYTISIDHFEGSDLENHPIFILDNLLNTVVNLKETHYSFTASKGIHEDRFTIVFEERTTLSTQNATINDRNLTLFPNPAFESVTLNYTGTSVLDNASIYNMNGQIVKEINLKDMSTSKLIDISAISTGIYFIKITSDNQIITKKLVVN